MPEGYHHLTHDQRSQIQILKKIGKSQGYIAKLLQVSQSTISRKLRKNTGLVGYRHKQAESKSRARRQKASSHPQNITPERIALVERGCPNAHRLLF